MLECPIWIADAHPNDCGIGIAVGIAGAIQGPMPMHNQPGSLASVDCREVMLQPHILLGHHVGVVEVHLGGDGQEVNEAVVPGVPPIVWHSSELWQGDAAAVGWHIPESLRVVVEVLTCLVVAHAHHVGNCRCQRLDVAHPSVPVPAVVAVEVVCHVTDMKDHIQLTISCRHLKRRQGLPIVVALVPKNCIGHRQRSLNVTPGNRRALEVHGCGPARRIPSNNVIVKPVWKQVRHGSNVHGEVSSLIPIVLKEKMRAGCCPVELVLCQTVHHK
mmetsp:Transcript_17466/g.41476  ORF Transcript_17466/g.41476 Transcript_17466/m.41476 type:complete len:273 (+) Transcript_17466:873-1691(+)